MLASLSRELQLALVLTVSVGYVAWDSPSAYAQEEEEDDGGDGGEGEGGEGEGGEGDPEV